MSVRAEPARRVRATYRGGHRTRRRKLVADDLVHDLLDFFLCLRFLILIAKYIIHHVTSHLLDQPSLCAATRMPVQ